MKKSIFFISFLTIISTFAAFSASPKVFWNLTYYKSNEVELQLDLATPSTGSGPYPCLVYIFGGGWGYYSGNRSQCSFVIQSAANHGYIAVAIDHRLTSVRENGRVKYQFPCQLYDVKNAVRWLRANSAKYMIDPNRIGVIGWSSGAHLALMLGLTTPAAGFEGSGENIEQPSNVQAVVAMQGMVEAISFYKETNVPQRVSDLLGGDPSQVSAQYRAASPITYVDKSNPPVLLIQGDKDTSCPPSQSQMLYDKMQQVGASCDLIIKPGAGHQAFYVDEAIWNFLDRELKGQ